MPYNIRMLGKVYRLQLITEFMEYYRSRSYAVPAHDSFKTKKER